MPTLHADPSFPLVPNTQDGRGALCWSLGGLRLWRRAPMGLMALSLVPLFAEVLLQQIPLAGVAVSKLVVPLLLAGVLAGVDRLARGGRLSARCLLTGVDPKRFARLLGVAGLLALTVAGTQLATVGLLFGMAGLRAVLLAQMQPELATTGFTLTVLLSGVLPALVTMLALPRVLFDEASPVGALRYSLRTMVLHRPRDTLGFAIIQAALLTVAALWTFGLALLLIQPWAVAATYVAYRNLSAHP